nr:protein PFC0760c-like [Onthophagus taurus]
MSSTFSEKEFEEFFQLAKQDVSSNLKDAKHEEANPTCSKIDSDEFNKLIRNELLQSNDRPTSTDDVNKNKLKQDRFTDSFEALITQKKCNAQCANFNEFIKLIQSELIEVKEKNINVRSNLKQIKEFFESLTDSSKNDSKDLSVGKSDSSKIRSSSSVLDEFEEFLESLNNADSIKKDNNCKDVPGGTEKKSNLNEIEVDLKNINDSLKGDDTKKDLSPQKKDGEKIELSQVNKNDVNDYFVLEINSSIDDENNPILNDFDEFIECLNESDSQKGDDNHPKDLSEVKEQDINACESFDHFEALFELFLEIDPPKNDNNPKDSSPEKDINDFLVLKEDSLKINDENNPILNQFEELVKSLNKSDSSNNKNDQSQDLNEFFVLESDSEKINDENYFILNQFDAFLETLVETDALKNDNDNTNDQLKDISNSNETRGEINGLLNLFVNDNISSSFYSNNSEEIIDDVEFNSLLNNTTTNVEKINNDKELKEEIHERAIKKVVRKNLKK